MSRNRKITYTTNPTHSRKLASAKIKRRGKITSRDGSLYQGQFRNSIPYGFGKSTNIDGSTYQGCIEEGKMNGFGVYNWPDGSSYKGEWKNNLMDSKGD